MTMENDLKRLREKAYLQYQQDGILEIVIGLAIIGFGLSMLASGFLVMSWLPILMYVPLKMMITVPRFGYVQFDSEQQTRERLTRTFLVGVMTLSLFTGLYFWMALGASSPGVDAFLGKYVLLALGAFVAIILTGGAYLLGIRRFYVYAVLTMGILWAGIELGIPESTFVIFLGLVFLVPGMWMLVQFLQRYPKTTGDDG